MLEKSRLWNNLVSLSHLQRMCMQMNNKVAANKAASPENTRWYESKSSADEEPSGSLNSHFADQDEEEAECSRVVAMATRLSLNFKLSSRTRKQGRRWSFFPQVIRQKYWSFPVHTEWDLFCSGRAAFKYFTQQPLCSLWKKTITVNNKLLFCNLKKVTFDLEFDSFW